MYFTDTPTLNSIEVIMKNCPMTYRKTMDMIHKALELEPENLRLIG